MSGELARAIQRELKWALAFPGYGQDQWYVALHRRAINGHLSAMRADERVPIPQRVKE